MEIFCRIIYFMDYAFNEPQITITKMDVKQLTNYNKNQYTEKYSTEDIFT